MRVTQGLAFTLDEILCTIHHSAQVQQWRHDSGEVNQYPVYEAVNAEGQLGFVNGCKQPLTWFDFSFCFSPCC